MPELPEVESLRLYLIAQEVPGRTIEGVDARWPGVEQTADGMAGLSGLPGRRIEGAERHGKNLFLPLDRGVLWLHMGMTGRLAVMAPDEEPLPYTRYTFHLDDERRIELDDMRRWASAQLVDEPGEVTAGLGPDALDPSFTAKQFVERMKGRRAPVKALLMDQHVLAGVGNIYADEALFAAGISPSRPANRISEERLTTLFDAARAVLWHAVDFIAAHPDEHGRPYIVDAYDGRMQLSRKKGAACPNCGAPLQTAKFGGRTAYYCGKCQR